MHPQRLLVRSLLAGTALFLFASTAFPQILATGDPRFVLPPLYPQVCSVLSAQFDTSLRATPPATDDTSRLQAALTQCAGTGHAVLLVPSGANNAFYSAGLTVNGEALIVGYGVTLFGNNYGTSQFISVTGTNAGIFGPGTIDGRGDLISGTPRLINVKHFENFKAAYVTLEHAAKMHLYIESGTGPPCGTSTSPRLPTPRTPTGSISTA